MGGVGGGTWGSCWSRPPRASDTENAVAFPQALNTNGSDHWIFTHTKPGRTVKVTLAMNGVSLVLLDDLEEGTSYGSGPLDSVITENIINERLLGTNKSTGPISLRPTWFLTGNNIVPGRDAHRRWLVCNIVSNLEHPEERELEEENLLEKVLTHRSTLLRDVLIILKAHVLAWYPCNWKARLGSFYERDKIVRGAVWCSTGLDCNTTRRAAASESPEYLRKLGLLDELEIVQSLNVNGKTPYQKGFTASDILSLANETTPPSYKPKYPDLRNALLKYSTTEALPSALALGMIMAKLNNVLLEGKRITKAGKDRQGIIWHIQSPPVVSPVIPR